MHLCLWINGIGKTLNETAWASRSSLKLLLLGCLILLSACGGTDADNNAPSDNNDEPINPSLFQFSTANYSTSENTASIELTVIRSGGSDSPTSVDYASVGLSATAGDDYLAQAGTLYFANGEISQTITLALIDDSIFEGDESLSLELSNPSGDAELGEISLVTVTITENDLPKLGRFEWATPSTTVNENADAIELTVFRNNGSDGAVSVDYASTNISATAGTDYVAQTGTLHFANGEASQTITLTLINDSTFEDNESFFLQLSSPTDGAELGEMALITITIADDDLPNPGRFEWSVASATIDENTATIEITVIRSNGSDGAVGVDYTTADLSATAGDDYLPQAGTLYFANGETSQTITLTLIDDSIFEGDESLSLQLSNATGGAELGTLSATVVTITENELPQPGRFEWATASATVDENTATIEITVARSNGSDGAVGVDYTTADLSATASSDYIAQSETLYFANGETSQTITLTLIDDLIFEGDESLSLQLSNATGGAELGDVALAIITITDDDIDNSTYTLSGTVSAGLNNLSDSDVNDPNAAFLPNDSFASAQATPNPVTVAGYLNKPGVGETGRSQSSGDLSDRFAVSLLAGQSINLTFADAANDDLDLYLYDGSCTESCYPSDVCGYNIPLGNGLIAKSTGVNARESITVPSDGNYFIEACIFFGASNYTLSIGYDVGSTVVLDIDQNFVPGDIVIRFKETRSVAQKSINTLTTNAALLGLKPLAGARGRDMLMSLGDSQQQRLAKTALRLKDKHQIKRKAIAVKGPAAVLKWDTIAAIKMIRKRADVLYAEPNYIHQPQLTPDDTFYPLQWHYPLINLPEAWDITTGSADVTIAIIDTGVVLDHPDLFGQLTAGYDFISNPDTALDGDGIDNNPDDPGSNGANQPSTFHGTHVAGTVAANSNNNLGVAGIAWQSAIMPLRVLGKGGGTSYDIRQAMRFAAGLDNDSGTLPTKKADVINLSLGSIHPSQATQDVINDVRATGTIIIAAAGNYNNNTPFYPASYDGVVSVSAVAYDKSRASYSNFNADIDVAAPGGSDWYSVASTGADNSSGTIQADYTYKQGTSMAAPHVAGVVALMKAVAPNMTPGQLDSLLASRKITEDLGDSGRDNSYGHGLIDAFKAVAVAEGNEPIPPLLDIVPAFVNLGSVNNTKLLTAINQGEGVLNAITASSSQPWLTINPIVIDTETGLGSYTIIVDRSGLAAGSHQADISFTSSANAVTVNVFIQVGSAGIENNSGHLYVVLIDEDGKTAGRVNVAASAGQYSFTIPDISVGAYTLIAGSNFDNDEMMCDSGESCGAYTTLDDPTIITVPDNINNLDFSVKYQLDIRANSIAPPIKEQSPNSDHSKKIKQYP